MVSPETQNQVERGAPEVDDRRTDRRADRRAREERGEERRREQGTIVGVLFGSSAEVVAGVGAIVLAVLGLIGVFPLTMAAIATIAIGAAILLEGGAIAARMRLAADGMETRRTIGGGVSAEMLGGGAGVVLGVLALVGLLPLVLLPIAVLVYGATLLVLGATRPSLVEFARAGGPQRRVDDRAARVSEAAIASSGGALLLAGAAAAVVGVLMLIDVLPPIAWVLIASLLIGGALLLSGSSLAARIGRVVRA